MNLEHEETQASPMARRRDSPSDATAGPSPLSLPAAVGNAAFTALVARRELGSQGSGPLDPDIADAITSRTGAGAPLPEGVRGEMEQSFGYDLSSVRVHTDSASAQLNEAVQAQAFTTGTDMFFSPGSFDPGSTGGKELIAHELTHVVQQTSGAVDGGSRVSSPNDAAEVEARSVAREVVSAPVVQRSEEQYEDE